RDPLPFLGDAMFHATMRPLIEGSFPLIEMHDELPGRERCIAGLTPLGEQVLQAKANWQDHCDVPRWVGGTQILPRSTHWALDDNFTPVRRRRFD
ncbi:hypothetical protein NO135_21500, partial [Clostridioides difficile]|nr:hypothetical protein [Clostridioides difficile]